MMQWLASEALWVRGGIGALLAGGALAVVSLRRARLLDFALDRALPVAVLACAVGIALRWTRSGQGPFFTLYEVLLSNLFSLGLVYFVACKLAAAARAAAATVLPLLALLGVWTLMLPPDVVPLPPAFDNPWLWAHVTAGKLFLGSCLIAAGLAARLLVAGDRAAGLDLQVWRFAAIAFVFDSFMLVAGAAWAYDAWGRYWAWDPLETWAFLTWLALGALLHARLAWRLPQRLAWSAMCGVFALAFLTFFGVPFLSVAPHKGVM